MKLPKFFKNGVHFECQGSGKCCVSRGEYGHVYFSPTDRKRAAKLLKITAADFTRRYCHKVEGFWALKDNTKGPECIFLSDNKCSIYEGRPTQCRTWPFWPEAMNSRSWKKSMESFCPGIGKGRLYSADEISALVREQELHELEMVKDSDTPNLA